MAVTQLLNCVVQPIFPATHISPVAVGNFADVGSGVIDTIDAAMDEPGILVNVAPRHGKAKKWPNGTISCVPEYYFFHSRWAALLFTKRSSKRCRSIRYPTVLMP
jgi:hypothetical protein